MEVMGLHLPGAAFVHPNTPLRDALTAHAARRVLEITARGNQYIPIAEVVDERAVVNGIVALMATGGSTNHTIHLVAMARAAGIHITWDDFDEISAATPLLARVYPNGKADVNHFHAAGGMALLIGELLDAGLLHEEVTTVAGRGLSHYRTEPVLENGVLVWRDGVKESADPAVVTSMAKPFSPDGGLRLMQGNLGRGVIKVSAVTPEHRRVRAPAIVFDTQEAVVAAHKRGELQRNFVCVVRHQGPRANGMPELHRLTPVLGALQDQGFHVALVTDGRMSGASGKVPMVIHLCPEVMMGGPVGRCATATWCCWMRSPADWMPRSRLTNGRVADCPISQRIAWPRPSVASFSRACGRGPRPPRKAPGASRLSGRVPARSIEPAPPASS